LHKSFKSTNPQTRILPVFSKLSLYIMTKTPPPPDGKYEHPAHPTKQVFSGTFAGKESKGNPSFAPDEKGVEIRVWDEGVIWSSPRAREEVSDLESRWQHRKD
jgi:hypothetical protein